MKKSEQIKILARAVFEVARDKEENDLKKVVDNFVIYLKERGIMSLMPDVLAELKKIYFKENNIIDASVVSKNELGHSELEKIQEMIKKRTGKKVEVSQAQDENVLGGAVIRYQDKLLDLSLKNQLISLKKQLANY